MPPSVPIPSGDTQASQDDGSAQFGGMGEAPASITSSDANGQSDAQLQALLLPGQPLHQKLLSRLIARFNLSQRHMSARYDDWDRVNEHLGMYIDLSRNARRSDRTLDTGKLEMPFDRAIVVPFSYAIHEVRKTQLFGLFAYREPFFEMMGRAPNDVRGAQCMEAKLAYDMDQTQGTRVIYSLINDTEKYGMGIVYDSWEDEYGWVDAPPPPPQNPLLAKVQEMLQASGMMAPPAPVKTWGCTREYNRLENVDPYNFFPDPRTPVSLIQNAEFLSHQNFRGYSWLMERSQENGGPYFNIDKLKSGSGGGPAGAAGSRQTGIQGARFSADQFQLKESADEKDKGFFSLLHFQVKIVPKEWQLGSGTRPEIWWFTVADSKTIIRAHPSPNKHGKFSYSVAEGNHDPHATMNPGMVELMDGPQRYANWLFNSNVENGRKFLNDALIYDPMLIEEQDLLNPGPARHIRVTATGSQLLQNGAMALSSMIQQLNLTDVTGNHLKTTQFVFDLMQRMSAANDPMMGQQTEEKRTLGEVQSIIAAGSQRIGVTARMIDAMAIAPMAQRMIANTQQFTTMEQWYRVTGNLAKDAAAQGGRLFMTPDDLAGDFTYKAIAGTLPADPARHSEVWANILTVFTQNPALQTSADGTKKLDLTQIAGEMVRAAGVRNLDDFYVDIQPDPQVQAGVQAGNLVPQGQAQSNGQGGVAGAGIQSPMVAVPGAPASLPGQMPQGAVPPGAQPAGAQLSPQQPPAR